MSRTQSYKTGLCRCRGCETCFQASAGRGGVLADEICSLAVRSFCATTVIFDRFQLLEHLSSDRHMSERERRFCMVFAAAQKRHTQWMRPTYCSWPFRKCSAGVSLQPHLVLMPSRSQTFVESLRFGTGSEQKSGPPCSGLGQLTSLFGLGSSTEPRGPVRSDS